MILYPLSMAKHKKHHKILQIKALQSHEPRYNVGEARQNGFSNAWEGALYYETYLFIAQRRNLLQG